MRNNRTILNNFLIALSLFALGCMSDYKSQEKGAVYDEAALKDFVLKTADKDKTKSLVELDTLLTKASADSIVFFKTIAYLEKPFGNPNSVYRNEDVYAAILAAKMKSEWIDSTTKAMTRERLYLLMQNRPGSLANDFTYSTASGHKKKMYDVKADHLLLYFYNPECPACKEMKEALTRSTIINEKATILAIYTDKNEMVWLDHLPGMPTTWMHGRDENEYLYKNKVYDLRAIPTVYLLDKDKRVLLKDCMDIKKIEEVLGR